MLRPHVPDGNGHASRSSLPIGSWGRTAPSYRERLHMLEARVLHSHRPRYLILRLTLEWAGVLLLIVASLWLLLMLSARMG